MGAQIIIASCASNRHIARQSTILKRTHDIMRLIAAALVASTCLAAHYPAPALATTASTEVTSTTAAPLTEADVAAWLDGFMPYALQRSDIAGSMVVIVKDGAVLFQKGYGYADVQARAPVDPERTLFRPGSISKLFTWTAVMQLVEQGKLSLDADVNRYLDFHIPARDGRPPTLREIMTHTAGFEEQAKGVFASTNEPDISLDTYVRRWVPERIFAPDTTPAYSNYASALAGYIVARIAGQSFDEYIEHHVFAPLQMARSSFRQPLPEHLRADMSQGYALASQPPKPYELIPAAPAGALATTGSDMAHFMIAHLQNGRYDASRILDPATALEMHTTARTFLPSLNRMLLGFYETQCNGQRVIGHGGDTSWFHSYMHLFLDRGIGLYASFNSAGTDSDSEIILKSLFTQFCDRYLPSPILTEDGVDRESAIEHARLLAATRYENSRRSHSNFLSIASLFEQLEVQSTEDGSIVLGRGFAGQPRKWREIAPFVWREVDGKTRLAAQVEDGRVVRFSFDDVSPFMVFEPAPWWRSSTWLSPLLLVSTVVLTLTALLWPVSAVVRRRMRTDGTPAGRDLAAYRLSRSAAVATVIVIGAWLMTFAGLMASDELISPRYDALFWCLQLASLVVFFGGIAAAARYAWVVWATRRGWWQRGCSLLFLVASATWLWVGVVYKLIAFDVDY